MTRQELKRICISMGLVALDACDPKYGFPNWMHTAFFKLARFWELMAGLSGGGPRGLVNAWRGHRRDDARWREKVKVAEGVVAPSRASAQITNEAPGQPMK